MKSEGIVQLGQLLSAQRCAEIVDYFKARPCYNLHYQGDIRGDQIPRMVDGEAARFEFGSYPSEVIMQAPHLIEALTSDAVLDVVAGYLGARPMLYSVNAYWSFPGHSAASYGQDYRDISHPFFCVLFVYLTDVDANSGAHQYLRRTHRVELVRQHLASSGSDLVADEIFSLPKDGLGFTELYERIFGDLVDTVEGKCGTAFIEDTYGLHRGLPPRAAPRLAAWARYSLFPTPPALSQCDKRVLGDRYPASERQRYALRGIVA